MFFPNPLQPIIPRLHIASRDLERFQRNASVQSLLLAGNLLNDQIDVYCWRVRGGKVLNILSKKLIFPEHPESKFGIL